MARSAEQRSRRSEAAISENADAATAFEEKSNRTRSAVTAAGV